MKKKAVSKDKMRGNSGSTRGMPDGNPRVGMDGPLPKKSVTNQEAAVKKFLSGKHLKK